jgi:hypothetical protein
MNFPSLNLNGIEYENRKGFKLISRQRNESTRMWPSYTVELVFLAWPQCQAQTGIVRPKGRGLAPRARGHHACSPHAGTVPARGACARRSKWRGWWCTGPATFWAQGCTERRERWREEVLTVDSGGAATAADGEVRQVSV